MNKQKQVLVFVIMAVVAVAILVIFWRFTPLYKLYKFIEDPDVVFIYPADTFADIKYAIKSYFEKGDDSICFKFERPYQPMAPEQEISFQKEQCSKIVSSLRALDKAKNTKNPEECQKEIYFGGYFIGQPAGAEGGSFCKDAAAGKENWDKLLKAYFSNISSREVNFRCENKKCDEYTENINRLVEFYNIELNTNKK